MEEEQRAIENLLEGISLFRGLDSQDISSLVDRLDVVHLSDGELLFAQGDVGHSLYIVYSGEISLSEGLGSDERTVASMLEGDFIGEEAVLHQQARRFNVRAVGGATLLRINADLFNELVGGSKHLKPTLKASEASLELASRMKFRWLRPHEAIHIVTRKHKVILWISMAGPILIALLAIPAFFLASLTDLLTPIICGAALLIVAMLYAVWQIIDWTNDYYIVTNQRVVWLEKIVGLYESRREAPMRTLVAVDVGTDQLGRIFGYGDVIVRSFTTQIILEATSFPKEVAAMIIQYWKLAQSQKLEQEEGEMVQTLRKQLGLEEPTPEPTKEQPRPAEPEPASQKRPAILNLFWAQNFKLRYEQGSMITYRKHWYLLLRKTWVPAVCAVLVLIFTWANLNGSLGLFSTNTAIVVGTALLAVVGIWWMYRYIDWRNDKYQLTPDSIVDLYKRPLGTEIRKAAPLENILSLSHERIGILGLLLNFGTVRASIGDKDFTFEGVSNPAQVQQEIFSRIDESIEAKRRTENAEERIRMAEWLAAYHRNVEDLREDEQLRAQEMEQE